jgi:toxin ParE1/3/4
MKKSSAASMNALSAEAKAPLTKRPPDGSSLDPVGAEQFRRQIDYIADDNLSAAYRLREVVYLHTEMLQANPEIGRPGVVGGTRELVISGTPCIAVYRVGLLYVEIFRFVHGAQSWR